MRTWIYHETKSPRVIDEKDLIAYEDGWSTQPFIKTTDCGIEPEDVFGVQSLGETIEGIKDSLNGALNLREMKPGQLKAYAQKHYGKSITGSKPVLIAQIESFINGNIH